MLGTGEGAELRQPLGIAIVGGLVMSQVLTLYTTPVVYLYLEGMHSRWSRGRARTRGQELVPEAASPASGSSVAASGH